MSRQRQPGLFDVDERAAKRTVLGEPLVRRKAAIDVAAVRADLHRVHEKGRKTNAGAKPFDVVRRVRVLLVQHLYSLSDDGLEYLIRDRLSLMRFAGLQMADRVPEVKTVWLLRERLHTRELLEVRCACVNAQLAPRGDVAKAGPLIDVPFVEVARQCISREANANSKAGETPDGGDDPEEPRSGGRRTLMPAGPRTTTRANYGDKNPSNADAATKLLRDYVLTPAKAHDSPAFEDLPANRGQRCRRPSVPGVCRSRLPLGTARGTPG